MKKEISIIGIFVIFLISTFSVNVISTGLQNFQTIFEKNNGEENILSIDRFFVIFLDSGGCLERQPDTGLLKMLYLKSKTGDTEAGWVRIIWRSDDGFWKQEKITADDYITISIWWFIGPYIPPVTESRQYIENLRGIGIYIWLD
ncbi:MAG: hypothetical protein JSW62_01660 [Thermoplasmatales archaeon]|nr:MAG: hypothetical protein JSW62_01660 [Thermoplasmatales archaeon]